MQAVSMAFQASVLVVYKDHLVSLVISYRIAYNNRTMMNDLFFVIFVGIVGWLFFWGGHLKKPEKKDDKYDKGKKEGGK
jgi:hypothetical protein